MFFLKFDPPSNPEMATAADVMCAKFFYALGYNVPENYIIRIPPEKLQIKTRRRIHGSFRSLPVFAAAGCEGSFKAGGT